jgi:hypothetical protein
VTMNAKRIFAGGVTTICLVFAVAGPASADPGNGNGQGPPGCSGPPGQTGLVQFAKTPPPFGLGVPPGQAVTHCPGAHAQDNPPGQAYNGGPGF